MEGFGQYALNKFMKLLKNENIPYKEFNVLQAGNDESRINEEIWFLHSCMIKYK